MKLAHPVLLCASFLLLPALLGGCGNKSDLVMPSKSTTTPPAPHGQPVPPEAVPPAAVPPADGQPISGADGSAARHSR